MTDSGMPHDYGQHCCCVDCTGPDGEDCRPDLFGTRCERCGRPAVRDDRATTAEILEAIAARVLAQLPGQLSWF
jgi:hypothetical protein